MAYEWLTRDRIFQSYGISTTNPSAWEELLVCTLQSILSTSRYKHLDGLPYLDHDSLNELITIWQNEKPNAKKRQDQVLALLLRQQ